MVGKCVKAKPTTNSPTKRLYWRVIGGPLCHSRATRFVRASREHHRGHGRALRHSQTELELLGRGPTSHLEARQRHAPQGRIIALLDRRIEGVHIDVNDLACARFAHGKSHHTRTERKKESPQFNPVGNYVRSMSSVARGARAVGEPRDVSGATY